MSHTVIDEYCKTILEHGSDVDIEELKTSFDIFVAELKKIDNFDEKYTLFEEIVSTLSSVSYRNTKFVESEIIKHEFFVILRDDVIVDQLHRRQIEENLDIKRDLLSNVSLLFLNFCYNIDNDNIADMKHLLFHKSLIDELANCLNDIGTYGKHLNDSSLLHSVKYLLLAFKHFRRSQMITNEYLLITPILFGVVQCLCSSYAVDMIKSLKHNFIQKLTDGQTLFLDAMPLYLQWYSEYRDPENFIKIIRILLNEFTIWMTSCHPDSFLKCSSKVASMIRHLNYFLIRPIESDNLNVLSEEFYHDYCKLVFHWSLILSSTLASSSEKITGKLSTRIIVQNLYNFTLHLNVLNFMKTIPNLIPMLLKVTDAEHDEIQLNAYRCLGKIMIETDIKTMANPDKIVSVYIEYITNTIDDPKNEERFYSLLESLKNFVQHDQVKVELIKQKALPLLVRCVEETQFDPIKVQRVALEILLALSFNNDACSILQQSQNFINHIRILACNNNSNKSGLQRAAEGLLWKLEKEEEAIAKPTNLNSYKYDIMISYSHKNYQICFQIHEKLVKDGFHVWIDRDCLRGSTMVGMANAIENSEYVLICMSNTYKQSVYCQSEAHYAFERGCHLIPIMIEENYKPDGWLGIIVSGKIYVNFTNVEFQLAYERLKNEINEQRHKNFNQLSVKSKEKSQNDTTLISSKYVQLDSESIVELPDCITEWNDNHVKSFFFRMKLGNTILPLCPHMNGHHLLQLYEMCLINRESMYQSLKFELNEKHHVLLPIADYITFLHEIKRYIPVNSTNVKTAQPSSLSLTFCNIT